MGKVSTKSKAQLEEGDEEESGSENTRVNIDNTYYFKTDAMSYTLCREQDGEKKDGTPIKREVVIGYYPTLEGLFKRYFKEQTNARIRNKTLTLLEFKAVMKEVTETLQQIARSLDVEITVK